MNLEYHVLYNDDSEVLVLAAKDIESDMVFVTQEMEICQCSLTSYLDTIKENPISRLMNNNQFKDFYSSFKDTVCGNMTEAVEEGYIYQLKTNK
jgi:hypothetical protein